MLWLSPEEPHDKLLKEMSQDVCDSPMPDLFPKPVHNPVQQLLQVPEKWNVIWTYQWPCWNAGIVAETIARSMLNAYGRITK